MALINLIDKITNGIDDNAFNISVFVDLFKAFDTVDHNILLQKLSCYGIKGHTSLSYAYTRAYVRACVRRCVRTSIRSYVSVCVHARAHEITHERTHYTHKHT